MKVDLIVPRADGVAEVVPGVERGDQLMKVDQIVSRADDVAIVPDVGREGQLMKVDLIVPRADGVAVGFPGVERRDQLMKVDQIVSRADDVARGAPSVERRDYLMRVDPVVLCMGMNYHDHIDDVRAVQTTEPEYELVAVEAGSTKVLITNDNKANCAENIDSIT